MNDVQSNKGKIDEALRKKEMLVVSGRCSVTYSGRAESYLPVGERLIIIKEDSTLLIHQPQGNTPVNYMKPVSHHNVEESDGNLIIRSRNDSLKEYLTINIEHVHFIQSQKLSDSESIILKGDERDMSDYIYSHPEVIEDGFKPLSREEHTEFGFIDVFGYDKNNILVVIECKRFRADFGAVEQLKRYVNKIKSSKGLERVRGIMAAPAISSNALKLLTDFGFSYKKIEPPKHKEEYKKKQKKIHEF